MNILEILTAGQGGAVVGNLAQSFGLDRQQAAAVLEMRQRGDGYGTIASAMGMTVSMVRRILQQQQEVV